MTFPRITLWVSAAAWAAFGLWLLFDPAALANAEVAVDTPTARTEVRAFYGGLELGVAAALAWLALRGATADGLRVALVTIAGVFACRTLGAVLEGGGVRPIIWLLGSIELVSAAITLAALRVETRAAPAAD